MLESYVGPARTENRKPYSYSVHHGDAFVEAYQVSRSDWMKALRADGASLDRFPAVLDPRAPREDEERRHSLDAWLQRTATEAASTQPLDAGVWCERIARAHLEAGLPLREGREGNWSLAMIVRWVQRFEAHGCIHTLYGVDGRRVVADPNRTSVLVRLALAAAWAALSAKDAESAVQLLNGLLKISDLVHAQVLHQGAPLTADERDFALAAAVLERRVLERVSSRVGRLSGEKAS